MTDTTLPTHPALTDHIPWFVPGPDGGDPLMTVAGLFLLVAIFSVGILYLKLHALPEHMATSTKKLQMDIVAVLALVALFTHQNIFWLLALVLAMIEFPDFGTPLRSVAASLEKIAAGQPAAPVAPSPAEPDSPPDLPPPPAEPALAAETGKV